MCFLLKALFRQSPVVSSSGKLPLITHRNHPKLNYTSYIIYGMPTISDVKIFVWKK